MPLQPHSKNIHVLYLPKWYPNKYDPMPGLFIKRHAESVTKHCNISVLYVHPDDQIKVNKTEVSITAEERIQTYRIYFRKSRFPITFFARIINLLKFFFYNFKGIKLISNTHRKPDLIHVNVLTRLGLIAMIYGLFTKTPYVITEHWTRYLPEVNSFKGRLRQMITGMVVKNAKAVMPVTENLQYAMQLFGLKNINYQVIPNVVDVGLFVPYPNQKNNATKKIVHLSCFTDAQKNISGILRVIKKLSVIRQDFELHLIGEGEDFDRMKQVSDKYRLTNKQVFFEGMLQEKKLTEAISSADLMILFSHYENLPVVILESFACGVPVISSRVGGIHEHLNSKRGALVEAGNEDQFLKILNHTLDELAFFNKNEIRQYAIDHFGKEVIGKKLYDIYTSIYKN
ncbi:MAG: hypothetical protein CVU00_10485 [Bacteroidetes bacterium HGW-Bacteroidetes-17]|nr:MAG: hypothetical protein CVU00_10485 [Bacteroidetes bacterium HGW-Bacteroidetes-17]